MKNLTNKTKTILFASLIAALILPFSVMSMAEAVPNENVDKIAKDKQHDEIAKNIVRLQIENQQLEKLSTQSATSQAKINDDMIKSLMVQADELRSKIKVVEVSKTDELKMEVASYKLITSKSPIYGMGVNPSTGILDIKVDLNQTTQNDFKRKDIQSIIGNDVKFNLTYGVQTAQFQSCVGQSGKCTPVIGGSFAEEDNIAQDCTLTIAYTKGSIDGVIMPHHCNPTSADMWQSTKGVSGNQLGPHNTYGGWLCDCDFVESSTRSIGLNKVNWGGSDYSFVNMADLSVNDGVILFGGVNGADAGTITKVNQFEIINGVWMTDLYEIDGIFSFDSGDSGAPIIRYSDLTFGGMNNAGSSSDFNYGHDWTFIKSRLGL